ncbi:unnamed protein product [Blepharisma stoltei]|uniref:Palmitoyltransferase n=1 Tax=Blepharisma stoltei TaxID=1481888 RepID=A0AAU9JJ51_9CILI|nr:unnamed protein product [Blepharisma stoltei]
MENTRKNNPVYSRISRVGIKYAKIANLHCFLFKKNGVPLLCAGPNWSFVIGLNLFFIIIGLLFIFIICPRVSQIDVIIGIIAFTLLVVSYTMTALSNPGICYNFSGDQDLGHHLSGERYCELCEVVKKSTTVHCDECGVCIEEYDHHCPWVSKCIGKNNKWFFYALLIGLLCVFVFIIATLSFKSRTSSKD